MKSLTQVEISVLERIKPKPEEYELVYSVYEAIKEKMEKGFEEIGVEAEASLEGSVSHDTWLSGDRDLDIFILFPKHIDVETIRTRLFNRIVELSRELGEVELRYAEHPYVRLRVGEVYADIVPAYKLDSVEEIRFAVDRTPFHTKYVKSRLSQELRDHVRLLKKFMKSIGVYGAEIKTRGFSGYVVELLIIKYGGFYEALENISMWKLPIAVNTIDEGEEFDKILKKLKKKYPDSIIYIPDPVDPYRNTTANVSPKCLTTLVIASNCYLRKPSTQYFFPETTQLSVSELIDVINGRCIVYIKLESGEDLPPDTIWGEAWRICDRLVKLLNVNDYNVIDYSVWSDEKKKVSIAVEVEECFKKPYRKYVGPDLSSWNRLYDFMMKHVKRGSFGPWIDQRGGLNALGVRKYQDIIKLLTERSWEYVVAPHFKGLKPVVSIVDQAVLSSIVDSGEYDWLTSFILKRPYWIDLCID